MPRTKKIVVLENDEAKAFLMRMYNSFDTDVNAYGEKNDRKIGYYKSSNLDLWVAFDNRDNKLHVKSCIDKQDAINYCVRIQLEDKSK